MLCGRCRGSAGGGRPVPRLCAALLSRLNTTASLYSAARRLGSSASISATILGGDIGKSRSRAPIAAWIALATAAIGGPIGPSPPPRPRWLRRHGRDDAVADRL